MEKAGGDVQHELEDGLGIANEQGKQGAAGYQRPRVFRVRDRPAEHPEQLPHRDKEQHRPGCILQHRKGTHC